MTAIRGFLAVLLFLLLSGFLPALADQPIEERITLSLPEGSGPFPAVILMHWTDGPGSAERKWSRFLNDAGIAAVILKSYGSIANNARARDANLPIRIAHLRQAFDWVLSQSWSSGRVSVLGRSHGAQAVFDALKTGALDSQLYRAVAVAPSCDGARGETRSVSSRTPMLIVVGSRDKSEYSDDCLALVARLGSGRVQIAEFPSGHSVDIKHRSATATILNFLH